VSAGDVQVVGEMLQAFFHAHEVRDGKVSRCRVFTTEAEAGPAAGPDA